MTTIRCRAWLIPLLSTITALVAPFDASAAEFSGDYKIYFVAEHFPEALHRLTGTEEPWAGSASQNLRLGLSHAFAGWLSAEIAYDLIARAQDPGLFVTPGLLSAINAAAYRAFDLEMLLFPRASRDVGSFAVIQNLDRFVLTANAPWFDAYIGRQAIAWGSARAVNPTDVLAPFLYTALDTEYRIGIDAVRARAPLGLLGEIDLGYVAGTDFEFNESALFLRARTFAAGADLAAMVTAFREHVMVGADVTRSIGGAGSWVEAAYAFAGAAGGDRDSELDYLRLSTGVDYSFGELYGFLEYHFNQAGADDPAFYTEILSTPAYTDGAVYLLGEHYVIPGGSYPVTPLTTLSGSLLVNLTDPSLLAAASIEHNFREDVYIEVGVYIGAGDAPAITEPASLPAAGAPGFRFNSEFGAYADIYYASFRAYF